MFSLYATWVMVALVASPVCVTLVAWCSEKDRDDPGKIVESWNLESGIIVARGPDWQGIMVYDFQKLESHRWEECNRFSGATGSQAS